LWAKRTTVLRSRFLLWAKRTTKFCEAGFYYYLL